MLPSFKTRSLTLICHRTIATHSHYRHGDISGGTAYTNPQRKPSRGGQSLSNRWSRLEKSIRQKASLSQELEDLTTHDASLPEVLQPRTASKPKSAPLFYGFLVPEEPKPPADDECCMSGCAVCVYDLHEESLEAYNEAVAALRGSLTARHIPTVEWPAHIQPKESAPKAGQDSRKGVILSAFEEMERKLALKKAAQGVEATSASNLVDTALWKKRQELVAIKKAEARDSLWNEFYETLRWVIFSRR